MVEAMGNDIVLRLGDVIFAASLIPSVLFLSVYVFKAPWFRDPIGRMFVFAQASLVVVSLVVLASLFLGPEYPGRSVIRVIGYSMHFVAQWVVFSTYMKERGKPAEKSKLPLIPYD